MKRLAVFAIAVVATAGVWAIFAGSGTAQQPGGERTLNFTERRGTFHYVDNTPRTRLRRGKRLFLSTGDTIVFTNALYDATNTRRVGTIESVCVAVFGRRTFQRSRFACEGTARLPDGQLALHSSFKGLGRSRVGTITGGTGSYEGTSGSFTSASGPKAKISKDAFHLVR